MQKSKLQIKKQNFFNKVYGVARQIPMGKVMTYGQIAERLDKRDSRLVGWALHANSDLNTPCHRVVNRYGRLADNFAFDGALEQKRRLLLEGVRFKDKLHVDLKKCMIKRES